MKRILYILPNLYVSSGVSTVVMNYYRKINRKENQIDFLLVKKYKDSYEKEVIEKGSKVFYLKNKMALKNIGKIEKELSGFFQKNYYDIVELHAPIFSFIFLKVAKKCNIPIRIVHSHSTIRSSNKIKNIISLLLNINMKKYANKFFACSEKSGQYWYGNEICNSESYKLITNGITVDNYKLDKVLRKQLRIEYDIDDKIVIGFVGRISKDKNLPFFIDVFKEVVKKDKKYFFLVIGDGDELDDIKKLCDGIEENVKFLGRRDDVSKQLNCMDLLVLPSKREGLPMVVVEAQLTELPCYISDTITTEVNIGNTEFIKLQKNEWVEKILNYKKTKNKKINREKFNIDTCVKELEKIYTEYVNEINGGKNDI